MARAAPLRSRRGRRVAAVLGGAVAFLVAVLAVAGSRGKLDTYPRTKMISAAQQRRAPAWTRPCWSVARWTGFATCLHVAGRVVWVEHDDPDGDGDRHLFVVSRLRLHLVKLPGPMRLPAAPNVGSTIDAVGWMGRGSHGRTELDAIRLTWNGAIVRGPAQG
jgi:hypothetical protein